MHVTMEFIARQTGVSKATVSRVINEKGQGVGAETRKRVKCAIEKYGYKPNLLARGVATAHTKIIGLVVSDICNPFFPALIKAIEGILSDHGYTVLLCDTGENIDKEERCISTLIANRVDGIVFAATLQNPQLVEQKMEQYQIPLVLVDSEVKEIKHGAGFCVDNEYGMYVATEYLMRHGNQNIAFIKGPDKTSATKERFAGYVAALQKHNFDLRQQLVLNGDFTFQSGYQAVQILHTRGVIFDAILASNDVMALGALKALQEYRYQVPQEIEVMGFDDIQASDWTNPPLTTMRQPLHELGTQAACAILSMVEKRTVFERTMRIEAELICRKTTRQQEIAACGVSVIKNEGAK